MGIRDARLDEIISKISYRPEVRIDYSIHEEKLITFFVQEMTPDSTTHDMTEKTMYSTLSRDILQSPGATDFIVHFIQTMLYRFESHEVDEWLRYDDKRVKEPHN